MVITERRLERAPFLPYHININKDMLYVILKETKV